MFTLVTMRDLGNVRSNCRRWNDVGGGDGRCMFCLQNVSLIDSLLGYGRPEIWLLDVFLSCDAGSGKCTLQWPQMKRRVEGETTYGRSAMIFDL